LDTTKVKSSGGDSVPASQLLRQPGTTLETMLARGAVTLDLCPERPSIDLASLETSVKYTGYLRRQMSEVERARKEERRKIPRNFPFHDVPGLSREVVQRLAQVQPDTLGQALRIPGVTPAAVAVLGSYVGKFTRPHA
jgi:tRNA uridine 5-carboxymethylaminomethyl modification enzyme